MGAAAVALTLGQKTGISPLVTAGHLAIYLGALLIASTTVLYLGAAAKDFGRGPVLTALALTAVMTAVGLTLKATGVWDAEEAMTSWARKDG